MTRFIRFALALLVVGSSTARSASTQDFTGTLLDPASPGYPMPPFHFENSRFYTIQFVTRPEVVRELVPAALESAGDSVLWFVAAQHNLGGQGGLQYLEAFLLVPTAHESLRGAYVPIMYLDRVPPIIIGREVWGFRKVEADLELIEEGGEVTLQIRRFGTVVATATFVMGEELPPRPPAYDYFFNVRQLPSVVEGQPPVLRQLVAVPTPMEVHGLHAAHASLTFGSTRLDPLDRIPVLGVRAAYYREASFTLGYGHVLEAGFGSGPAAGAAGEGRY